MFGVYVKSTGANSEYHRFLPESFIILMCELALPLPIHCVCQNGSFFVVVKETIFHFSPSVLAHCYVMGMELARKDDPE